MEVLEAKWGRAGAILTPRPISSFLLFGVFTSVPILVKIDQEIRPHTDTHTDRLTDRQTQTDSIIRPILYAIAINTKFEVGHSIRT